MLVRWRPSGDLNTLQREMNDLLDRVWGRGGTPAQPNGYGAFLPPVDVRETESGYVVDMDLPGMEQKDIDVGMENGVLTIRGERKAVEEKKGDTYTATERIYGSFLRSFSLPGSADGEKISAVYKNGVLTVKIPKREEAKPRSIKVEVK
jgi:HSP20 family protein